jgi:hypothetical protein
MFFGNDHGQQEIAHCIRKWKNDALRLQRFEKDDFALVIAAIRDVPDETAMPAGPYQ